MNTTTAATAATAYSTATAYLFEDATNFANHNAALVEDLMEGEAGEEEIVDAIDAYCSEIGDRGDANYRLLLAVAFNVWIDGRTEGLSAQVG